MLIINQKIKTLSSIYPELLKWTTQNQNKNELPKINITKPQDTIFTLTSSRIIVPFSTDMDTSAKQISFIISKIEGNRNKGQDFSTITNKQFQWIDARTLQIDKEINYDEFFNNFLIGGVVNFL